MPNINDYAADTGFGSGLNRTKFDSSGQRQAIGDATQWDDLVGDAFGKKLNSTTGKLDYNWDENALKFQSGGDIATKADRLVWNVQKMHKVKEDSELRYHIHFEKENTTAYEFTLQYRIQGNGEAKTTAWTTLTTTTESANEVFPYTSGTLNQIVKFPAIDWSAVGISSTVNFRLARTDSKTGDVLATFIDGHIEIDSDGSNQEYVK